MIVVISVWIRVDRNFKVDGALWLVAFKDLIYAQLRVEEG